MYIKSSLGVYLLLLLLSPIPGLPQTPAPGAAGPDPNSVVVYPAAYFGRFQPQTALDMVRQVPGFQLENNATLRGYSEALGNLLINDRRPAAKQDQPLDILSRIPASQVLRIELIRGPVREIDMQGQTTLVNVILREDKRATVQWDAYLRQTFYHGGITPKLSVAVSDEWRGIDYNAGLGWRRSRVGADGVEDIFDDGGRLVESRIQDRENRNSFLYGNFNATTRIGGTFLQLNTNFSLAEHLWSRTFQRLSQDPPGTSRDQFIHRDADEPVYEAGLEMERSLQPDLTGKAIFLLFRGYVDGVETQRNVDASGDQTLLRVADTYNVATEGIGRLELDWSGLPDHAVQLNLEHARNVLDGRYSQSDDTGGGPFAVVVPGANSRVEETRWDFLLKDTWSLGVMELDYGLGAEASTLRQTGDVVQERDFFFLNPQLMLSHVPEQGRLSRLRLAREVAQLDLEDFISAAVLEDDDLALGNPDIRPDTTWVAEVSHERRFGRDSVIKLTGFHHWITDVLDLLPLSEDFEAPGNIGDGRRWGVELENTLPLDRLGLGGARLKTRLRWQDSTVTDPVTGRVRGLSTVTGYFDFYRFENGYAYNLDFRQDFQGARAAWGFILQNRAEQYRYKVNELEVNDEALELNAFVETTRWLGVKLRLDLENVTDYTETRERTVYAGERALSPLDALEIRRETGGPRIFLTASGSY